MYCGGFCGAPSVWTAHQSTCLMTLGSCLASAFRSAALALWSCRGWWGPADLIIPILKQSACQVDRTEQVWKGLHGKGSGGGDVNPRSLWPSQAPQSLLTHFNWGPPGRGGGAPAHISKVVVLCKPLLLLTAWDAQRCSMSFYSSPLLEIS